MKMNSDNMARNLPVDENLKEMIYLKLQWRSIVQMKFASLSKLKVDDIIKTYMKKGTSQVFGNLPVGVNFKELM